jgi:hypothetical protein
MRLAAPPLARTRARLLRAAAALALGAGAGALSFVAWRDAHRDASLEAVRFLDHPEKVTGRAAAVTVTGYVVATVGSDSDFFALARAEGSHPKVVATLCDSGKPLDAWADPLPVDVRDSGRPFGYSVLVPARSAKVDLAAANEDVCVRLRYGRSSLLGGARSRIVVVPVRGPLREQLVDYARRDGVVQLVLDPACVPLLCQPDFTPDDLNR